MPPLPKTCPKTVCPRKGVAFLWKAFLQKKFSGTLSMRICPSGPLRLAVDQIIRLCTKSEGPCLASGSQGARTYAHLFRIPAASYARPVCRWKDLGPRLKTCQRGSLGDHGPG